MDKIQVEHKLGIERPADLGVASWLLRSCEGLEFPWTYDSRETCYLPAAEVIVTPEVASRSLSRPKTRWSSRQGCPAAGGCCRPCANYYRFE